MNCPICNQPMVHYRLTGYECFNRRHNEMARELSQRIINDFSNGKLTEQEWNDYMDGIIPDGYLRGQSD